MSIRVTAKPRRRLWPSNKALFTVHGWLGMNFGLLLVWVCLSGAIAAVSHEIEWLTQPALRIEADGPIRWQATLEAVRQAYPEQRVARITRDEVAVIDGMAWTAQLIAPDGSWSNVRVDPYAAEVVRGSTRISLPDFMRQTHYVFFDHHTAWGLGFYLVTFVGFPLLLSIVTALLFFKRWWRHFFRLRLGQGLRPFVSSLHRVAGVWSFVFGLIIALTSIWYLIEAHLPYEITYPSAPAVSAEQLATHGTTPPALPLERYIDAATTAFPKLSPTGISLPRSPDGTVQVQGQAGGFLVRDRANAVFLDPHDASVVAIRDAGQDGLLNWWVNAADSLHFGYWGGLAGKILWAVFGLALPVMVLTGAYLSWRRAGVIPDGNPFRAQRGRPLTPWWRRRPLRTWLMIPLTGLIIVSIVAGYEKRSQAPPPFVDIGTTAIGPWQATVHRAAGGRDSQPVQYSVAFDAGPGQQVNLRRATLQIAGELDGEGRPLGQDKPIAELNGAPEAMHGRLSIPSGRRGASALRLTAETWSGQRFKASLRDTKPYRTRESNRRYAPAVPGVFFGFALGYAVIALGIAVIWWLLDIRAPSTRKSGRGH